MTRGTWEDIGEWPHHRIGGSIWFRVMIAKGYQVIVPPVDMVEHIAFRNGVNWKRAIDVSRTLLKGEKVEFNYKIPDKKIFKGSQRNAGVPVRGASNK